MKAWQSYGYRNKMGEGGDLVVAVVVVVMARGGGGLWRDEEADAVGTIWPRLAPLGHQL